MATTLLSPLAPLLQLLTPRPTSVPAHEYTGTQYRKGVFIFRPAEFVNEFYGLVFITALLVVYYVGKSRNYRVARAWIDENLALFESQFKAMSPLPASGKPYPVADGPSTYLFYLTGRRNLLSTHVLITLSPRHNLLQTVYHAVRGIIEPGFGEATRGVEDEVVLDFTLGEGARGLQGEGVGVWGVVRKSGVLAGIRKERWDVSFTKTHESAVVPQSYIVLQETHDCTNYVLDTPNVGLASVLARPQVGQVLKSLLITDQPATKPTKGALPAAQKSRHLILTLRIPRSKEENELGVKPLLQVVFNLVDLLGKGGVKPETTKKLRKIRTETDTLLSKDYAKRLADGDYDTEPLDQAEADKQLTPAQLGQRRLEERKEEKRKKEEERRKGLSVEERRKLEEKDRKKALRKQQKGAGRGRVV